MNKEYYLHLRIDRINGHQTKTIEITEKQYLDKNFAVLQVMKTDNAYGFFFTAKAYSEEGNERSYDNDVDAISKFYIFEPTKVEYFCSDNNYLVSVLDKTIFRVEESDRVINRTGNINRLDEVC